MNTDIPQPTIDLLDPTVDFVFKMLFGTEENKESLISFLNAVLGRPEGQRIESLTLLPVELEKEYHDLKGVALDVRAQDQQGRHFDVEIQCAKHLHFPERAMLYWARMYSGQFKVGDGYHKLNPVISILITGFVLNDALKSYHSTFQVMEVEQHLVWSEHFELHLLELPKYLKKFEDSNGELEQWMAFLKEGKDMTQEQTSKWAKPEIEKAWEELEKLSKDPKLRLLYDSRMKQILDEQARHDTAIQEGLEKGLQQGLEQGLEKGLQQGLEQGLQQGLEQGLEQGREVGIKEGILHSAKMLLEAGMALSEISKLLQVSEEELQPLLSESEQS